MLRRTIALGRLVRQGVLFRGVRPLSCSIFASGARHPRPGSLANRPADFVGHVVVRSSFPLAVSFLALANAQI